jgi:type IV secretory pathway TraG/TraD family ATPase VirD4
MTVRQVVTLGIGLGLCLPVLGTQVVAHQLRYAAWLGQPMLRFGRAALYAPHEYVRWSWHYSWYYPAPFDVGLYAMAGWLVGSAVLVAILLKRSGWQRRAFHADAAWATTKDIRKAGLFVRLRR